MSSAIAILTYQRKDVLKKTLDSLCKHVPKDYPVAIFDDCSLRDNTIEWLRSISTEPVELQGFKTLLDSIECEGFIITYGGRRIEVFAGKENLGVAANSNRAIRWFELATLGFEHLFLCNDDLTFLGDAVTAYRQAHKEIDVGLLCFNNLKDEAHQWQTFKFRGHTLKAFRMMTGAVMSMTANVIKSIGYFDPSFGKFGEEHCDYTNRARMKGFLNVMDRPQICLDVEFSPPVIDHQHEAESSVTGQDRKVCDQVASQAMQAKASVYRTGQVFQAFRLRHIPFVNRHAGFDAGIKPKNMPGVIEAPAHIVPFE